MHRVRAGLDERPDRGDTLRQPRPFVEQAAGRQERFRFDGARFRRQRLDTAPVGFAILRVAEPGEPVRRQVSETRILRGESGERHAARKRILGIEPARDFRDPPRIADGVSEDRHAVERSARRHDPARRPPAPRRLEPDEPVEGRRYPAGAGGIGTQRKGDGAVLDRHRRAAAAAAGDVRGIDGVRHGAVRRPGADQPRGELVQVGLPDGNGPGGQEPFDHRRGTLGNVRVVGAAGRGRRPGEVDVVLDGERDAPQRRLVEIQRVEPVDVREHGSFVEPMDPYRGVRRRGPAQRLAGDVPRFQQPLRIGPAQGGHRSKSRHVPAAANACPARTVCPLATSTSPTIPAVGAVTSNSAFIDSTTNSTSPAATR